MGLPTNLKEANTPALHAANTPCSYTSAGIVESRLTNKWESVTATIIAATTTRPRLTIKTILKNCHPPSMEEDTHDATISPDYARNFICDFILGKKQTITEPTLFDF